MILFSNNAINSTYCVEHHLKLSRIQDFFIRVYPCLEFRAWSTVYHRPTLNHIIKMQIILNGQQKNLDHNITLSTLLDSLNLQPDTVVVEINGRIIKPGQDPLPGLKDGDKVELIRFVGGG